VEPGWVCNAPGQPCFRMYQRILGIMEFQRVGMQHSRPTLLRLYLGFRNFVVFRNFGVYKEAYRRFSPGG
jgi:hypothetical protein